MRSRRIREQARGLRKQGARRHQAWKSRLFYGETQWSWTEATSVFGDPLARIFADEHHSAEEQREIIIGNSRAKRLVLVCFTEWADGRVRIISARRATRKERHDYEDYIWP